MPVVDGESHEPNVAVSKLKLVYDRYRRIAQLEVVVERLDATGLPDGDRVLAGLQIQNFNYMSRGCISTDKNTQETRRPTCEKKNVNYLGKETENKHVLFAMLLISHAQRQDIVFPYCS